MYICILIKDYIYLCKSNEAFELCFYLTAKRTIERRTGLCGEVFRREQKVNREREMRITM